VESKPVAEGVKTPNTHANAEPSRKWQTGMLPRRLRIRRIGAEVTPSCFLFSDSTPASVSAVNARPGAHPPAVPATTEIQRHARQYKPRCRSRAQQQRLPSTTSKDENHRFSHLHPPRNKERKEGLQQQPCPSSVSHMSGGAQENKAGTGQGSSLGSSSPTRKAGKNQMSLVMDAAQAHTFK